MREPVIARVTVTDDNGSKSTYYFCRAEQGMPNINTVSYLAKIGRLAALEVGEEFSMHNGTIVEVLERALFRPTLIDKSWDSHDTLVQCEDFGPITIESLRALLNKVVGAEITEDLLDQLFANENLTANVCL
jgi:hypothetical protein